VTHPATSRATIPGAGLAGQEKDPPGSQVSKANFTPVQVIEWGVDVGDPPAIR